MGVVLRGGTACQSGAPPALVHRDAFLLALARERLRCIWVVTGERSAWPNGNETDVRWRSMGRLYRLQNGVLVSSALWHEDTIRTEGDTAGADAAP